MYVYCVRKIRILVWVVHNLYLKQTDTDTTEDIRSTLPTNADGHFQPH